MATQLLFIGTTELLLIGGLALLLIGGKKLPEMMKGLGQGVQSFKKGMNFDQGQMAGIPRGGKIIVRVKALNDGTPDLLAWMTERSLPKNGEIKFLETKTNKEMKSIKFTNGYCVNFEEKWEDKMGHFEEITITCKQIEFGNVKYENDWA